MTTDLVQNLKSIGLEETDLTEITDRFEPFIEIAETWKAKAFEIVVTEETQLQEMAAARSGRLELKKVRVDVEKMRKALKADYLRRGKAIDGVAKILESLIRPLEEHLDKQEKFAERRIAERAAKVTADRIQMLELVGADVSIYNFESMTEESFGSILKNEGLADIERKKEAKAEKERQEAEDARIEAERVAESEERIRISKENQRLRDENAKMVEEAEARRTSEKVSPAPEDPDSGISDSEYVALLGLIMASDPSPISDAEDKLVRQFADREAVKRGFDSWVVAYHKMPKSIAEPALATAEDDYPRPDEDGAL